MNEETESLASRRKRLGGFLIDSLLLLVIEVAIMRALAPGLLSLVLSGGRITIGLYVALFAFGWLVFLLLNGNLLSTKGQTIGKAVVKTRIVDPNGNVPSFGKLIVLRYVVVGLVAVIPVLGSLFLLGDVLFIFGEKHRCIHDYMAGTRVINV